ncbi:MAG: cadherin-like domain-containing protein [Planctomycetes bacterium]|nr:cadherin-like domain-containing protein [Planctomycetota bacterium]
MPATIPITLFSTGVTSGGGLLADNQNDPHYELISNSGASLMPGATRTLTADGFPIGPWIGNGSDSRWIVPAATDDDGNAAAGSFDYRTTFDLTGIDPSTVTISGLWAADDDATISLNGVDTGVSVSAGGFQSLTTFSLATGFRVGMNTLDFLVHNSGGPTGLRVSGLAGSGEQTSLVAAPNTTFGTGLDSSGQPLAGTTTPAVTSLNSSGTGLSDLGSDSNFAVTSGGSTVGVKVRTPDGGFPFPYWAGGSTDSAWLIPANADNAGNAPPGVYSFTTTVNVTDPTNLVLSGTWAADDTASIWVNGTDTGVTSSGYSSMTPFTLSGSYLHAGANTVEFRVTNGGTSNNPTGVRVQWDPVTPTADPHWTVVDAPNASLLGPVKVIPGGAYPFPRWVANDSNSEWIAPLGSGADASATPGTYKYQTTIDLTGYDPTTAVLSGRWSADNEGVNVYLNGTPLNLSVTGPNPGSGVEAYWGYADLYIANGVNGATFQAGINTLTFEVRNDPLSSGNPSFNPVGLRVDGLRLSATNLVSQVSVIPLSDGTEGGLGTVRFTRSGDLTNALPVTYSAVKSVGGATPGLDYFQPSGSVVIPAGDSFVDVNLQTLTDQILEGDEVATVVVLRGPNSVPGTPSSANVTIHDHVDVQPDVIHPTEGVEFYDFQVASFVDASASALDSSVTAMVDWGDGSPSEGTVNQYVPTPTHFGIYGTHKYAAAGVYTITTHLYKNGTEVGSSQQSITVASFSAHSDSFSVLHDHPLEGQNTSPAPGLFSNDGPEVGDLVLLGNTQPTHGTVVVRGDGTFTYTPAAGFTGSDSFQYTVSYRGNPSTATANILVDNIAPYAPDIEYAGDFDLNLLEYHTQPNDPYGSLTASASDYDDDLLTITELTLPQHGQLVVNSSDGSFRYLPDPDFTGNDSFTYTVSDGVATATGTVSLVSGISPLTSGQNVLGIVSSPPTAPPIVPAVVDLAKAEWAKAEAKVKEETIAYYNSIILEATNNANRIISDRVLQKTDKAMIWFDTNRVLHGTVLVGDKDNGKPFGYANVVNGKFSFEIYSPIKNAEGNVTALNKLTLSDKGLDGKIGYSEDTFVTFLSGKFTSLQYKDSETGVAVAIGSTGIVSRYAADGIEIKKKTLEFTYKIDEKNFVTVSSTGKVQLALDGKLNISITPVPHQLPDVQSTFDCGKAGTLTVGYNQNQGIFLGGDFQLSDSTQFTLGYRPQADGSATLTVGGKYSWVGNKPQYIYSVPPSATLNFGATVNNNNKSVDWSITFGITAKW